MVVGNWITVCVLSIGITCLFLTTAKALLVNTSQCVLPANTSTIGQLISVDIEPCPKYRENGCYLKKQTNSTVTIEFKTNIGTVGLKHRATGKIFGAKAPFHGIGGLNACKHLLEYENSAEESDQCQLNQGTTYTYRRTFPVNRNYPAVSVEVEWQLLDGEENIIICFTLPAKIKN